MLRLKELFSIIIVTIILGIVISLVESLNLFLMISLFVFLAIFVNVAAKKIFSYYLDTEIEVKIWEMKQFGIKKHLHFRKPILAGIFAPLIIKFVSVGIINWMACLTFDTSGKVYRAAKRHGIYSFSEVTEEEMGWIAGAGIIANLLFAVVAYMIGQESLAKISITYAFFNMIPAFDWDGAKIFFGNIPFWSFLAIISSIAMIATIVVV
ncbi:hypothetical protein COU58_02895 [Candidatus Pacearchaeota archaeon CG10_big_fil_rev_8_21_14_0_10_32_42]|nr:MAG: hypothetical protein COU58_02895 [Candidatus Pacearchaeota archaeon CG10_big_fil_rev_8_21_14_0_10_32_42]